MGLDAAVSDAAREASFKELTGKFISGGRKNIDEKMAALFEDYYRQTFGQTLNEKPQIHRVIPIKESIQNDMKCGPMKAQ